MDLSRESDNMAIEALQVNHAVHPLVSIVIPVFNCEKYVAEAIDSVLSQDYPNIELIVLDDGSTDLSWEVINRYPASSFIRDSHPNRGQSATLNKGWSMSQGDYLSYLSADDALLPGAISSAVSKLESHEKYILAYGDYQLMDDVSLTVKHVTAPEFDFINLVLNIDVQPGPGVFFRRSAFDQVGGWDELLRQIPDYEYWIRLALLGSFLHLPLELARFRVHAGSQSFSPIAIKNADEILWVTKKYFERTDVPAFLARRRCRTIAMAYVVAARYHLRSHRSITCILRLLQACTFDPFIFLRRRAVQLVCNAIKYRIVLWGR